MTTSVHAPMALVAGLDRRFHAFVVDRLLGWVAAVAAGAGAWWSGAGTWVTVGAGTGALAVVGLLLAVLLGCRGVTPGKALLGLRVVDVTSGTPIGVGRALGRQLVLGAATLPMLGLGAAALAWTAAEDRTGGRRGGHDHLARSVVVDVRTRTAGGLADGGDPAGEQVGDERPRQIVNLTAMRLVPAPAPAVSGRPTTGDLSRSPAPRRRRTPWRISVDTGESLLVEGVVLVGRDPGRRADQQTAQLVRLRSVDMSISKTHAQFHVAPDGALVVTDRGSTNGTVLVRQGLSRELGSDRPATLVHGDLVGVGDREIRVTREADGAPQEQTDERGPQWR